MRKLNRPPCPHPQALTDGNYKHPKNKQALNDSSFGKCMYCEGKVTHVDYGDVEHIKPKAEGLFPELEFVWDNLGFACAVCNITKSSKHFPDAPILNPYEDDPENHLYAFGALLFTKNGSERGEMTIREVGLNRPTLVEQRTNRISAIAKAVDACNRVASPRLREAALEELLNEAAQDKEFSAVVAAQLRASGVEANPAIAA
ncbi:HNH endonuclease [Paraburkholderia sp. GV068]|uniref:HNH endonuclease n=1 Tax=unclassified Paraburkholderia TaxID=2615204 RepID=UPI000D30727A|nr:MULTISPECIES: HNH endonuclease [unclassified Paraburkholderia]PTR04316.1 HNH endonuclease [Paraburkholderia sp. GV072]PUB09273.1 HNH endonuclease [Paraburkholderia sp. GV068]